MMLILRIMPLLCLNYEKRCSKFNRATWLNGYVWIYKILGFGTKQVNKQLMAIHSRDGCYQVPWPKRCSLVEHNVPDTWDPVILTTFPCAPQAIDKGGGDGYHFGPQLGIKVVDLMESQSPIHLSFSILAFGMCTMFFFTKRGTQPIEIIQMSFWLCWDIY